MLLELSRVFKLKAAETLDGTRQIAGVDTHSTVVKHFTSLFHVEDVSFNAAGSGILYS